MMNKEDNTSKSFKDQTSEKNMDVELTKIQASQVTTSQCLDPSNIN